MRDALSIFLVLWATVAQAAITRDSCDNRGATNATSVQFTVGTAGYTSGDFCLAAVSIVKGDVSGVTMTAPGGWTLITQQTGANPLVNGTAIKTGYWYLADCCPTCPTTAKTWTWTFSTNVDSDGTIMWYKGVSVATPIDVADGQTNASSASQDAPSITTTVNGDMLVAFYAIASTATSWTAPTGFNACADRGQNSTVRISGSNKIQASSGATGIVTATAQAAGVGMGELIALEQEAPTATPTQSVTSTPTNTPTVPATSTSTVTPTDTATDTPTLTPTPVFTDTPTDTPSVTPTSPPSGHCVWCHSCTPGPDYCIDNFIGDSGNAVDNCQLTSACGAITGPSAGTCGDATCGPPGVATVTQAPTFTQTPTDTPTDTPTGTVTDTPTDTPTAVVSPTHTAEPCTPGAATITQVQDLGTFSSPSSFTVPTNADCLGAGNPIPCCTGFGTGTCLGYIARHHVVIMVPEPLHPDATCISFSGFLDTQANFYTCPDGIVVGVVLTQLNPGDLIPYPYSNTTDPIHVYDYFGIEAHSSVGRCFTTEEALWSCCSACGFAALSDVSLAVQATTGTCGFTPPRFSVVSGSVAIPIGGDCSDCLFPSTDTIDGATEKQGCVTCDVAPETPLPTDTPGGSPSATPTNTPTAQPTVTMIVVPPTLTPTATPTGAGVCMPNTPTPTPCVTMPPVKIFAIPRPGVVDLAENRFSKEPEETFAIACMYSRQMRHDERIVSDTFTCDPIFNINHQDATPAELLQECTRPVCACDWIDEQRVVWTVFNGTDGCSYQNRFTAVANTGRTLICEVRMDVATVHLEP